MTTADTTTVAGVAGVQAAITRLRAAVETATALAPLRRLLVDVDEELRAAAGDAREAGLSERSIAARAEVSQPTVRDWLDGRRGEPLPAPSLAERLWCYHQVASALLTLVHRVDGDPTLPGGAPTTRHIAPTDGVAAARKELAAVVHHIARAAAATEYATRTQ